MEGFIKLFVQRLMPRLGEQVYANVADWIDCGETTLDAATAALSGLYGAEADKVRAEIEVRMARPGPTSAEEAARGVR